MGTTEQKNDKNAPRRGGTPIFAGKTALIRFVNNGDPETATVWFADNTNKTIRPFVPEAIFDQMFDNPEEARKAIVTLSADELGPDGIFKDFEVLGDEYGVQPGGEMKPIKFSKSQLQQRYGQPPNPEGEAKSMQALDGLLSSLTQGGLPPAPDSPESTPMMPPEDFAGTVPPESPLGAGGVASETVSDCKSFYDGIGGYDGKGSYPGGTYPSGTPMYGMDPSKRQTGLESFWNKSLKNILEVTKKEGNATGMTPSYIESIINNPGLLSYYSGAMTYGGYQLADVFADIVKESSGTKDNVYFISPTVKRTTFYSTSDGKKALEQLNTILADKSYGDASVLKYGMSDMPEEIFKELVPLPTDYDSPEFKAEMEKINTAYYDALMEVANATTDVEHTRAKYNLDQVKKEAERSLGITLSDNTEEAWKQLESLSESMSQRGIQGSGIHSEISDELLRKVRSLNERARTDVKTKEEKDKMTYYQGFASPAEIAALSSEDRVKYGLTPPSGFVDKLRSDLKTRYPNMTDQEINDLVGIAVDENGNLRSNIYQKNYQTIYDRATGIVAEKKKIQEAGALKKASEAQEKAFKEFTLPTEEAGNLFAGTERQPSDAPILPASQASAPATETSPFVIDKDKKYTEADFDTPEKKQAALKAAQEAMAKMLGGTQTPSSPVSSPTPVKQEGQQYSTLYDYLVKTTGKYNPVASSKERQDLASKYGISNYTGAGWQNEQLLKAINSGQNTAMPSAPKIPTVVPKAPETPVIPVVTPKPVNPPISTPSNTGTSGSGYSFNKLPSGMVEVLKNGQRVSTGTASVAKDYGYSGI